MADRSTALVGGAIPHNGSDQWRRALAPHSGTALWHRNGEAPLPIRWVLLRDPSGKRRSCALFCTDPAATMHHIIAWYVDGWQIEVTFEEVTFEEVTFEEVTFEEVRCHLGVETHRQ